MFPVKFIRAKKRNNTYLLDVKTISKQQPKQQKVKKGKENYK